MEIVIFGFCVIGCGVTSYFIGHQAGVKLGAGLMFDTLYKMGKENPDSAASAPVIGQLSIAYMSRMIPATSATP